jgi:hypothetical protein
VPIACIFNLICSVSHVARSSCGTPAIYSSVAFIPSSRCPGPCSPSRRPRQPAVVNLPVPTTPPDPSPPTPTHVSFACSPLLNTQSPPITIILRVFIFCSPWLTSEYDPLQVGAALLFLVVTYGPPCHDLAFFCTARDPHLGPHLSPSRSPSVLHVPARD